ncbi:pentatricopeptide repeat-containing protein [Quercus suber]|uniref:Pentatricopeptide repeat-containing protein n=1 Tax=Quercus suber TaxID=58331 RepID=A0AAW0JDY5_QUESU
MSNPAEPDVWGALLGACRIHNNMEMGEIAAKNLFPVRSQSHGFIVCPSDEINIKVPSLKHTFANKFNANQIRNMMAKFVTVINRSSFSSNVKMAVEIFLGLLSDYMFDYFQM